MMWRPLALCTTSLVYHSHGQNQAKSLIKLFNFCHNANRQPWEVRQLFSITKYRSYSACGVLNTSDGRRVRRMLSEDSCQLKQMLTPQQNVRFTQSTRDVATKRKEVQTRDPDTDPGALTTGQKGTSDQNNGKTNSNSSTLPVPLGGLFFLFFLSGGGV